MSLNFPDNPMTGDEFSAAGVTWHYDGVKWTSVVSPMDGPFLPLSGGTMSGGIGFGTAVGADNADTSQHISLYGTSVYGFGVTGNRLNYVAPTTAAHVFEVGGTDVATVGAGGLKIIPAAHDPLELIVPAGYFSRLKTTVSGVRTWSMGTLSDGRFGLGDETAGIIRLFIDTAGLIDVSQIQQGRQPIAPMETATKLYVDNTGPATVNIKSHGALCDGVTDDSAAINAAITEVITMSHGGTIILPAGRTVVGSAITATIPAGVTLTIKGMGGRASELYFSTATDGLNFQLAGGGASWGSIGLDSFAVVRAPTSPAQANTGINLHIETTSGTIYGGYSFIKNVTVFGSAPNTNQWLNSIVLTGVSNCVLDNVFLQGINAVATDRGDVLLSITGTSSGQFGVAYGLTNSILVGGSTGVSVSQYVQGVFISNSSIAGQYDSVRWIGDPVYFPEQLAIVNSSLNANHRGVYSTKVNQVAISETVILRFTTASADFAGVEINQGAYNSVMGNNVVGGNSGTERGYVFSNCGGGPNICVGNTTTNMAGIGIWLSGGTVRATVTSNNLEGGTEAIHQDTIGNTIVGNTWNGTSLDFTQATTTSGAVALGYPLTIRDDAVAGLLTLSGAPTSFRQFVWQTSGANPNRWCFSMDGNAESGSSAGSNLVLDSFSDAGAAANVMSFNRASGVMTLAHAPIISTLPANAANDGAAASAGVQIGGEYRNGSVKMIRVA